MHEASSRPQSNAIRQQELKATQKTSESIADMLKVCKPHTWAQPITNGCSNTTRGYAPQVMSVALSSLLPECLRSNITPVSSAGWNSCSKHRGTLCLRPRGRTTLIPKPPWLDGPPSSRLLLHRYPGNIYHDASKLVMEKRFVACGQASWDVQTGCCARQLHAYCFLRRRPLC